MVSINPESNQEQGEQTLSKREARKAAFTKRWGKRAGIALFLFFLIKGLLWLIVPAVLYWYNRS